MCWEWGGGVAFVQLGNYKRKPSISYSHMGIQRGEAARSKQRAVISKMARLLNDNSQASVPVPLFFHCCRLQKNLTQ